MASPQTLTELRNALESEGVNPRYYSFTSDGNGEVLRIQKFRDSVSEGWRVYYAERGLRTSEKVFRTEAEACQEFYRRLASDPTVHSQW